MRNTIGHSPEGPVNGRCGGGPSFENLADSSQPRSVQSGDEGSLKVVHSRSRIVLQQRICNGESNIGEPRSFAGVIQRERVGVIDKVGGVSGFESCFLEQRHRGSKIAVLQSFKGWLITHSAILDQESAPGNRCGAMSDKSTGLLSLTSLKMLLGSPLE